MKLQNIYIFFFLIILTLTNCSPTDSTDNTSQNAPHIKPEAVFSGAHDGHSYARPREAVTKHLDLNLNVNFENKQLKGSAKWQIQNNNSQKIFFDVNNLNIEKVTIGSPETSTTFRQSKPDSIKGSALSIDIQAATNIVTIYYSTKPDDAAALDWLEAELTADKNHPALFTQGQAILTRTWIPCQDSPGIRITYNATIEVPKGLMAVMSASNPQLKNESGIYHFEMKQPIPPYLIALAVGDLEFKPIGARTGVYAEPSVIDAAVNEFAEMENMLEITEKLYGPYAWDRYDVIVLPPSFPFGGMENPRLTFATPTIIAGDRSLVSLIAHELAHSWSGNLVTNATWDDFWLNEGFTVYIERRIMEALEGAEYADMLAVLGKQDLDADIHDLKAHNHYHDTHLKLDLKDRDPDDGMTDIAYEKGAFFLTYLEQLVGRDIFDNFIKQYFEKHKFQTLTTEEFINYLNTYLLEPQEANINLEEWIYSPGLPKTMPPVESKRFKEVNTALETLVNHGNLKGIETSNWSTHEWLHFIRGLNTKSTTVKMLQYLENKFQFSDSGNAEILAAWFETSIKNGYGQQILPKIESFLIRVGRRKFLTPLYRAMKENGMMKEAKAIYEKARPNYHSVSRGTMDKLLEQ